jgi:hypothetical protein
MGFGAGDSRGSGGFLYNVALHLLLGRIYDDKDVQEQIVRRSKLDWECPASRAAFTVSRPIPLLAPMISTVATPVNTLVGPATPRHVRSRKLHCKMARGLNKPQTH